MVQVGGGGSIRMEALSEDFQSLGVCLAGDIGMPALSSSSFIVGCDRTSFFTTIYFLAIDSKAKEAWTETSGYEIEQTFPLLKLSQVFYYGHGKLISITFLNFIYFRDPNLGKNLFLLTRKSF